MVSQKDKGEISENILYRFISKNPKLSTYEISKKLDWEGGKVRTVLTRIEKAGLIKFEYLQKNNRIIKVSYASDWKDLLNSSEFSNSKKKDNNHSDCGNCREAAMSIKHI